MISPSAIGDQSTTGDRSAITDHPIADSL